MSNDGAVVAGAEIEMSSPSRTAYAVVPTENALEARTSHDLTWVNLNFKVKDKNILSKCWGKVRHESRSQTHTLEPASDNPFSRNQQAAAGSVSAILGPSGAGKSSLLNVLAGRSAKSAGISIDGKVLPPRQPRRLLLLSICLPAFRHRSVLEDALSIL